MTNPFWLTVAAILMTFNGDAPIEIWFPLLEDIARNIATGAINIIMNLLEVLM